MKEEKGGIKLAIKIPENKRRDIAELERRVIWLYGAPFSGKTTLADNAPNPLMLNTDGNAVYVTSPYIEIKDDVNVNGRVVTRKLAWDVFKDVIKELETTKTDYETLVVDLVNDTYELCRSYMYDKLKITHESDDSRGAWDKVRHEYLSEMSKVTKLPFKNIILLSHETSFEIQQKGKEKVLGYRPTMQEKVASSLAGMVGVVGRAYVDNGKHLLDIKSDDTLFGGGRLGISNVTIPLDWKEIEKLFDNYTKKNK